MSHYCTLSGLQAHPAGTIVCDESSIGEVKVNSYRYFKAVEEAENA
jgi:glucosamine-6-phosphate deaminase